MSKERVQHIICIVNVVSISCKSLVVDSRKETIAQIGEVVLASLAMFSDIKKLCKSVIS